MCINTNAFLHIRTVVSTVVWGGSQQFKTNFIVSFGSGNEDICIIIYCLVHFVNGLTVQGGLLIRAQSACCHGIQNRIGIKVNGTHAAEISRKAFVQGTVVGGEKSSVTYPSSSTLPRHCVAIEAM